MRWIALLTLLAIMSSPLMAEELPKPQTNGLELSYSPNWPEPPDTSGMLIRLVVGTVITIGLCVGTMYFGRRWLTKLAPRGEARQLQVEECLSLGHRASLYLVKVGDTRLIAGTDVAGLKSLIVLPPAFQEVFDKQVEDAVASADSEPGTVPFATIAQRAA